MAIDFNMKRWASETIAGPRKSALPLMNLPGAQLTGANVRDIALSAECQLECMQALAARFPSSAIVTMMDLSIEAEAFGCRAVFNDEEVPVISENIVIDDDAARRLSVPPPGAARTAVAIEVAHLASSAINDRPVFGCVIGPFSLAGRLCGIAPLLSKIRRNPAIIVTLLDKCVDFLSAYASALKTAGLNGIIIAEPVAGLLSPAHCDMFSSPHVRRIVESVQDDGFITVLHNCGNVSVQVPSMLSTGAIALHVGNSIRMIDVLDRIPPHVIAMGNLNPSGALLTGAPVSVREETLALLKETASSTNFILSSGCDMPFRTPIANIDALFGALREYNGE